MYHTRIITSAKVEQNVKNHIIDKAICRCMSYWKIKPLYLEIYICKLWQATVSIFYISYAIPTNSLEMLYIADK